MQYYIINKPFGFLSQFTREAEHHQVLGDLYKFPKDVYPVGRLDKDSEGLLILTNDTKLNHRLLNPKFQHERTYLVQVEGIPTEEALKKLAEGPIIKINKKAHRCLPAGVKLLDTKPDLEERDPPVRFRKNIPTSFIELSLKEGKNRQVRRMCAAVGFPVLRLIRQSLGDLALGDLPLGGVKEMEKGILLPLLKVGI